MHKISFPFHKERSSLFGEVYRPIAQIAFWSLATGKWINLVMIVDTGADYTLLPHYMASILGVDLHHHCQLHSTGGIGGTEKVFLFRGMQIKIGKWKSSIPVGFMKHDNVPPLLGRQDCLEKLGVLFFRKKTTFIFQ